MVRSPRLKSRRLPFWQAAGPIDAIGKAIVNLPARGQAGLPRGMMQTVLPDTSHEKLVSETEVARPRGRWGYAFIVTGCMTLALMLAYGVNHGNNTTSLVDDTSFTPASVNGSVNDLPGVLGGSASTSGSSGTADDGSRLHSVTLNMGCPEFEDAFNSATPDAAAPFRSFTLTKGSGYAYVAIHLSKLHVPEGTSIILRAVEGFDTPDRTLNLSTLYPSGKRFESVLAPPVLAKEFRIEFYRNSIGDTNSLASSNSNSTTPSMGVFDVTDSNTQCFGFVVDSYYYVLMNNDNVITSTAEAICANDNSKEAVCYYADENTRTSYLASRAVARLLIQKGPGVASGCTGWLLGNQGHMITNHHCVSTDAEAQGTTVEFMAEAKVCSESVSCQSWGACVGTIVAVTTELIHADESLDYALLKLPTAQGQKLAAKYGYLRLKQRAGVLGEQVYIPQHPLYQGKRIALVDDFANRVALLSVDATSCGVTGYSYSGDTQSGSSGSPVITSSDHGVVALHHCGEMCRNTGVPAERILADLVRFGVDVAAFDGVDTGSGDNVQRFPAYTPPVQAAPVELQPALTLDGALVLANSYVSVDHVSFTLNSDAEVSFDVLSAEIADDDLSFHDLNGDCRASYLDAMLYLFADGESTPVFAADDSAVGVGVDDGSVSYRDPFKRTFLKQGSYTLAVAPMCTSAAAALDGKAKADYAPELYSCRTRGAYGSYRLQISSSVNAKALTFTKVPAAISIDPTACHKTLDAICSF